MTVLNAITTVVERIRTAAAYKLPLDDQPFTARRAAQEIAAQAAVRSDLDERTVVELCAHLRLLDDGAMYIPSVVYNPPTRGLIAHRVRLLKEFNG
jgi:hypothetical protein